MSRSGRRPGSPDTRAQILAAARREFAERGYAAASLRAVARKASVDPALVHHYFVDKPGLFVASLDLPADPRRVAESARGEQLDGARIVERFLAQWEEGSGAPGSSFLTLTQAISSSPGVARAFREFLTERVWAARPGGDEPETARRAALVSSQLLGAAWARYVVRMEPLASATRAEVASWLGPAVEGYATGRLPGGDPGR